MWIKHKGNGRYGTCLFCSNPASEIYRATVEGQYKRLCDECFERIYINVMEERQKKEIENCNTINK